MCCVSNVGLPVLAGLAVAVGAFGFASIQPEPTAGSGHCTAGAGSCCSGTTAASSDCTGSCEDMAKNSPEDPHPEAGSAKVGEAAPDFALLDLNGERHQLSEYIEAGKVVVLEWFNPECPFVVKVHERTSVMADTYAAVVDMTADADTDEAGVVWLAINSGREGHATSDHDFNAEMAQKWGMEYPVLLDPTGEVGHAYGAKTTPHMFVISPEGTLVYAGAIDNNPSARQAGDVNYVIQAVQQMLAGETITDAETRPYGCGVKY